MRLLLAALVLALVPTACGDARADVPAGRGALPAAPPAAAEPSGETPRAPWRGEWIDLGRLGDRHHGERRVRAWVPEHDEGERLPALVVLDGQGATEWFRVEATIAALAGEGLLEPWVVIAVDSTENRDRELARTDGRLARFLRDVVLTAARARLPLRDGRASTAILGYSYGGLAAVAASIAEPATFGRAIAMSPSLWVDGRDVLARFERARSLPMRLWVDVGSAEPDAEDLIPYVVGDARDLRDLATGHGLRLGRDVGYLEVIGEVHDMAAAGRRMREALLFALSDRDLTGERPVALSLARYPARRRRATFAVEARYPRGERLTFPETLVEVRAGETRLRHEIAPEGLPLSVRAFGLEARAE